MAQQVALVTGSNKGIGLAIVRALCRRLDNGVVYLTARDEGRGKEAVAGLHREGLQPRFHQLDVTDHDSVKKMRDFLKEKHGGLDILVNNAGVAFNMNATESFAVQASVSMVTNFTGLLDVSRVLFPLVRSHGRIVHLASTTGKWAYSKMSPGVKGCFQAATTEQDVEQLMADFVESAQVGDHIGKGWPDSAYGTSKMGVIALTKVQAAGLARDPTRDDVLVTCCCPGFVATDLTNYKGRLTVDQGAETPVYLALLPSGSRDVSGKMFYEKKPVEFW